MAAFILVMLSTVAYLQVGFALGKRGWIAWRRAENASLTSYLFFPASHLRRRVGIGTISPLQGINPEEGAYRVAMLFLWPLVALANGIVIAVTLPSWLSGRKERLRAEDRRRLDILEAENRVLDEQIRRLESEEEPPITENGTLRSLRVPPYDDEGEVSVNASFDEEIRAVRRRISD